MGHGPSSHPRGWCPQEIAGAQAPQLIYRQREPQGGDGAVLTVPRLPSSSPVFITSLYTADPKSPRTYPPPPSDHRPICPAGSLLQIVHRRMTRTTSKIRPLTLPQILSLLPLHLSSLSACPPSQTPGGHARHLFPIGLQSSRCHLPNRPPVIPFLIYPLGQPVAVRHRLCQVQTTRAVAVPKQAASAERYGHT